MKGLGVYQPPPYAIPSLLPFRTGGSFYDSTCPFMPFATFTGRTEGQIVISPTLIPKPSLLVNLGIEVTSYNNSASSRIAVYDSVQAWDKQQRRVVQLPIPDLLICETGVISMGTATGYKNGAVAYRNGYTKLPQGLVWIAFCQYTTGSWASYRAAYASSMGEFFGYGYPVSTNSALWTTKWQGWYLNATNISMLGGWPLRAPLEAMGANHLDTDGFYVPRVIMEF